VREEKPPVAVDDRASASAESVTGSETPDSDEKGDEWTVKGVSAAYVGLTTWPSASTTRRPPPSLPVFGTERPPVATMTASAKIGGPP
jgi:hypothetical protein